MYHFISGYTAKVAGTEVGVTEPSATFSPCFGGPFLVWHPTQVRRATRRQDETHHAHVWLVNTGWSGGSSARLTYEACSTRRHHRRHPWRRLAHATTKTDPVFGFGVVQLPGLSQKVLSAPGYLG